jgi:hypothetical protein
VKIVDVDVWKVVAPTVPGTVNSPEFGMAVWDQVPKLILRLRTDAGLEGIGETYRGVAHFAVNAGIALDDAPAARQPLTGCPRGSRPDQFGATLRRRTMPP